MYIMHEEMKSPSVLPLHIVLIYTSAISLSRRIVDLVAAAAGVLQ